MSTTVPGPVFEGGRFLLFNCNSIQNYHAELQDFLRRHLVLLACFLETKLCVNSSLNEFIGYATIRRDRPFRGGNGGLVTLIHLSLSSTSHSRLMITYSPMVTRRKFWQSRQTSGGPHWLLLTCIPHRPNCVLLYPTLAPSTSGGPWRPDVFLTTLTTTIPPGSPEQGRW